MIKQISRRKFLHQSSVGVAALSALGFVNSCDKKTETKMNAPMPMRVLGNTGLQVSQLAFGGGSQFLKNKDGAWEPLLERAIKLGINYFDTSCDYKWSASMSSEERYGMILPKYRDQVIIATKFSKRDVKEAMQQIETSLKRMKIEHVDVLMLHSVEPSEDLDAFEKGMYPQMLKLKEQGVAKFIGFSSMNSAEKSRDMIERFDLDVALLAMNPTKYGNFAQIALPAARKKNMGVLAMKVMRDIVGKKAKANELIDYALGQEGVASACIGHFGMKILEENVQIVQDIAAAKHARIDRQELESRLAHLAGPHALCWARPDYYDGMVC